MKPRSNRFLPQTLVVCIAPLLACVSASAGVVAVNEANTTNIWTLPAGPNLLAVATVTSGPPAVQEGLTSNDWAILTDGVLGAPGEQNKTVAPTNNVSVTYALDLTSSPAGFDITAFDSYATWPNSGRDNQNYSLQVSPDGTSYYTVKVVSNISGPTDKATHTNLTDTSPGSVMAKSVKYVRVLFGNPTGQENGYVGMSELHLQGVPTNVVTVNDSNSNNVWTLPAGTNLLNGATASPLTTAEHELSSPFWSTVTNGLLGVSNDPPSSVTPNNNTSVIFPLNLAVNFNGYNISSIDTYAAWANSGRDNQDLAISYSTVAAPDDFLPLGNATNHTTGNSATHVKLTPVSGFLATGVAKIKFDTLTQENGYVGLREFIALGSAVALADPLTWTGGTDGVWSPSPVTDSNWKKTIGGATSPFNSLASLTFDNTGANPSITVSAPLTASSMAFTSGAYTFGGSPVTVSNDIASSGAGSATFNSAMKATTGVSLSDTGSLVFNGALESTGLIVSGTGGITLNAANPLLTGTAAVSDGTLTVSNNNGLQSAGLSMTGGTALFTSSAPLVGSIASPFATPSIILGETSGPVNTNLSVGDSASVSIFGGTISQASGTTGSLTKTGGSSLTLSGDNNYTGTTTVSGGTLQLTQRVSLYHDTPAFWTAGNIIVASGATLGFDFGTLDEFSDTNLNNDLSLGGFASGSTLGINTLYENLTLTRNLPLGGPGLIKTGPAILTLTGTNTSTGLTTVSAGTIHAASTGGSSIGGNARIGTGVTTPYLNMGADNQFGPDSVVTFANGNFYNGTMNLRGTSQTIAGLNAAPFPANKISLVQNDETSHPGYAGSPGPASLTINATTDHSFAGIIRNQDGGPLSLIKNGPGTQELVNLSDITSYNYTGPTSVNAGTLKINFAGGNNGFASNITVANGATLAFNAVGGDYNFNREIHGAGAVTAKGVNALRFTNPNSSFTGGLTIGSPVIESYLGFVALAAQNGVVQGAGNGEGQTCIGGAMIPTNVITVQGGATLALDGIGPLGESTVLPQYAPSIVVNHSGLRGGGLAFVPNLTLNHAEVTVGNGIVIAGFDTSLCFVGTVTVGGDSNLPSTVITPVAGPAANISLGSAGLPGTTFNVTDVTGSAAVDFNVDAVIRNLNSVVSPLTKTGAGTMWLRRTNTYTGDTTVSAGELLVSGDSIANTNKLVIDGGKVGVVDGANEVVDTLFFGGIQQVAGTYGSTASAATNKNDSRFTGTGIITVNTNPGGDPYLAWSTVIPNAGDRGRTSDPDGDGLANLQEYLFGTSPIASTGSSTQLQNSPSGLIVRWSQRIAVGTYTLQESTTLVNPWGVSPVVPVNAVDQSARYSNDYVIKEAVIPVDSSRKFVRVQGVE